MLLLTRTRLQYEIKATERELEKAHAGFQVPGQVEAAPVATGSSGVLKALRGVVTLF
jgi:hypothetical protein